MNYNYNVNIFIYCLNKYICISKPVYVYFVFIHAETPAALNLVATVKSKLLYT